MAIYPLYYTTNNIIYSLLYSIGYTKLLRNVNLTTMTLGTILTFFLIAPSKYFGIHLGAVGVVIPLVFFTFISYNIYLWFSTQYLAISYKVHFLHQIYASLSFIGLAFFTRFLSHAIIRSGILSFFVSGVLYILGVFFLIIFFPSIFHISWSEVKRLLKRLTNNNFHVSQ